MNDDILDFNYGEGIERRPVAYLVFLSLFAIIARHFMIAWQALT